MTVSTMPGRLYMTVLALFMKIKVLIDLYMTVLNFQECQDCQGCHVYSNLALLGGPCWQLLGL
jgi:hypothetical protein